MDEPRALDVICLGRATVDLYAQQIGSRLEDVSSFAKYLGGSPCNIAFGAARLGLRSAMLTRVGDEPMGRFVREELAAAGVDTSHVITDPRRLTGLAILGIKDRDTFPMVFYRRDCADMGLCADDFGPDFVASSQALLITGTHLSTDTAYRASKVGTEYARRAGTKVILDIDYRPAIWGARALGEAESGSVTWERVIDHLQTILPECDLIVGTEEEIQIAGGSADTMASLRKIRELTTATIVLKLGPLGCTVLDGGIPGSPEEFHRFPGVEVEVLNVVGAGDAFLSGFLRGFLRGESYERCCRYANACGALVVSRHGCAPATPTAEELDDYLSRAEAIPRPAQDKRLSYLHRVTTRVPRTRDELCILAFDHRKQFHEMAIEAGADPRRIPFLKRLLVKATERGASEAALEGRVGVLIDDTYGQEALNAVTGRGWWIGRPVEVPASRPLELEGGSNISERLNRWPREHVVKCLAFYHPDDEPGLRTRQELTVESVYRACLDTGHEFLLELIPPKGSPQDDHTVVDSMRRFYDLEIFPDWWKLPPPGPSAWPGISELVAKRAPHCRGVVLLGLDAPAEALRQGFNASAGFPICKGFAVGRTIFGSPSRRWFAGELSDEHLIHEVTANYLRLIGYWRERRAR